MSGPAPDSLLRIDLPDASAVGRDTNEPLVRRQVQSPDTDVRQSGAEQRPAVATVVGEVYADRSGGVDGAALRTARIDDYVADRDIRQPTGCLNPVGAVPGGAPVGRLDESHGAWNRRFSGHVERGAVAGPAGRAVEPRVAGYQRDQTSRAPVGATVLRNQHAAAGAGERDAVRIRRVQTDVVPGQPTDAPRCRDRPELGDLRPGSGPARG